MARVFPDYSETGTHQQRTSCNSGGCANIQRYNNYTSFIAFHKDTNHAFLAHFLLLLSKSFLNNSFPSSKTPWKVRYIQCIALNQIKLVHTLEYLGYFCYTSELATEQYFNFKKKGMKSIEFLLTFTNPGAFNFIFLQSQPKDDQSYYIIITG